MSEFFEYLQSLSEKIATIDALEAIKRHKDEQYCFVDLRDGFELLEYGMIPGAVHCPRGSLEFRIPRNSEFHRSFFDRYAKFVFYCSHGQRSILATHTAQDLGLGKVCHIEGGMIAWAKAGGPVEKYVPDE